MKRLSLRSSALGCIAILTLIIIGVLPIFQSTQIVLAAGTITGTVYRDYNANGARDAVEPQFAGITVTAFDSSGVVRGSATTVRCSGASAGVDTNGVAVVATAAAGCTGSDAGANYSLAASGTGPYRIEFSGWPAFLQPSAMGTANGTTVQFVPDGNSSNINLGFNNPAQFCQNNPDIATNCYLFGDQVNGPNKNGTSVRHFPYASGTTSAAGSINSNNQPGGAYINGAYTTDALTSQTGAVWGMAYQRDSTSLFLGSFMKRHAGFGPTGNPGTIYRIDQSAALPNASAYVTLNAGPDQHTPVNTAVHAANPAYFDDLGAFNSVGNTGLGDLELSDDGATLYAVNMFDGKVYAINIGVPALAVPPAPTAITPPTPTTGVNATVGCAVANVRPGALKFYDGALYVGLTCTGPAISDLRAYVYRYNVSTATFSANPVAEVALNYPRGCTSNGGSPCAPAAWQPWVTDSNSDPTDDLFHYTTWNQYYKPQPWMLDLEIDEYGFMMLNFADRAGHQLGNSNAGADSGPLEGVSAGDLLRLAPGSGTWTNENNASVGIGLPGGATTGGAGNNEGPGGGEYYYQDRYGTGHNEIYLAGAAQMYGKGEIVTAAFDPAMDGNFRAGGLVMSSNSTGKRTRSIELFGKDATGTFGKAAGVGDIEVMCDSAPIEIGNRVWRDDNANGIQDAGEPGLAGVTVTLYDNAGTLVPGATAATDATGNYVFSSDTIRANTASAKYNLALLPNIDYQMRVATAQASLTGLALTGANTDASANGDARDSDAIVSGGNAVISLTTGAHGANNHTYDFGFVPAVSVGNRVWWDKNNNSVQDAGELAIAGVKLELFFDADNNGTIDLAEQTPIATTTSDASGLYLFTQQTDAAGNPLATPQLLRPGTYVVGIAASNFAAGQPLVGGLSSGTSANASGALSETVAPDPNSVASDTDDNGMAQTSGFYSGGVLSLPVTLSGNTEPTGENPDVDPNPSGRPDANDNQTVDFGFYTLQLGSQVWRDADNSGTINAADGATPGIANVRVRLFAADGTTEIAVGPDGIRGTADDATGGVLTDASGNYRFRGLAAGNYIVEVDTSSAALTDYLSSTGAGESATPNNNIDSDDNGTVLAATTVRSTALTLTPNAAGALNNNIITAAGGSTYDPTVDFGFVPQKVSLGNLVWFDTNNNGALDGGELPISGVTVRLYADTNGSGTFNAGDLQVGSDQTTDASGHYLFSNLDAGDYFVQILPANFSGAGALVGYTNSNSAFPGDANNNKDHGTPVAGQGVISEMVTLTPAGEPITDGDTDPTTNLTIDFGFYRLTVGNQLWHDDNNDGVKQAGESAFGAGIHVELYDSANMLIAVTTTDASGTYLFDQQTDGAGVGSGAGLVAGDYYVKIPESQFDAGVVLAGYYSSTGSDTGDAIDNNDNGAPVAGDGVRSSVFTLTPGAEPSVNNANGTTNNPTIDFGFYTMSLGNLVWNDANDNGVFDAGETPLANVVVNLLDGSSALLDSTTTNASGHYLFTGLAAGDYIVELDAGNFTAAGAYPGYTSSTGSIGAASGSYEPAPDPDTNTADSRDNGSNQAGGIRSGVITIVAGGEPTSAVETGGNTVTNPAPDSSSNLTVDFGIFAPVSLGNRIWVDANNNGAFDPGELAVPDGVQVNLYYDANGDGAIAGGETTAIRSTTISGGLYLFANLVPGKYMVELDAGNFSGAGKLVGYTSSTGTVGAATGPVEAAPAPDADPSDTDDNGTLNGTLGAGGSIRSALVTLTPGSEPTGENPDNDAITPDLNENLTVDFGVFQPARLGDLVWYDANHNGVQDGGETGVQNVTVTLYDSSNVLVATATTDASGNYQFINLTPGSYHVVFSNLPAGDVFTVQDSASATDATDSDADSISGQTGSYTLVVGDSNQTIDAGIYSDVRASLGDVVWYDTNENGVQDSGENGVPNVAIDLYEKNAGGSFVKIATTTTIADGSYLFSNLLEGDYYVQFTPPAGYALTGKDLGGNDATDSDADPTTHQTIPTHLDPGENDPTWDAGMFYSTVALGNRVWEDSDNNGVYNIGEPGLAGATVTLYRDSNDDGTPDGAALATATTDTNGFYLFNGLTPDTYIVEVAPPAGYISSSGANGAAAGPYEGALTPDPDNNIDADDNGTTSAGVVRSKPITLTRGGEPDGEITALPNPDTNTPDFNSNLMVDFGFYQLLSLGNQVWHDSNDNGLIDGAEQGISGVTVKLYDASSTLVATTTTDGSGNYLFTNLAPGDYTVEVTTPSGFVSSTNISSSSDPNNSTDSDDNGVLVNATTVRAAAITLATGSGPSDDPGQPAGNANRNTTVDFGFYQPLSLGNLVWGDSDNNGVVNGGESGIDGVTVNLYRDANSNGQIDAGEFVATQTTSGGGLYLFSNLRPGDYIVELPAGNFSTGGALEHLDSSTGGSSEPATDPDNDINDDDNGTAQAGGAVLSAPVTLVSGGEPTTDGDADVNTNLSVDFGLYPLASLGDYVWLDTNKDGVQNKGESGVAGVSVQLYQPGRDGLAGTGDDVLVATTTSGASGDYQFIDLVPGDYFVQFNLPPGYAHSPQDATGDTSDSDADTTTGRAVITTLIAGENDTSWDAGIFFTASLGDRVWLDQNANGIQDAGEPGVAGVTVTLYTSVGVPVGAPAITDANGNYAFPNLPPGDYYIAITPPASYVITPADQGANDSADSDADTTTGQMATTTLAPGANDPNWDAGLYQPVSLGNLVWNDYNNNGVVDGGESGIDGVVVNLYRDANGNGQIDTGELVATQITSGGGLYLFPNLVPSSYLVQIDPANFSGAGVLVGYESSTGSIGTNMSAVGPYEPAPSPNNDLNDDDNGSIVRNQGIVSAPIILTSGDEPTNDGDLDSNSNLSVDFGVFQPASVGSIVWYDTNKDGLRDPGETGVPGVTVTLYDGNGHPVATTVTDANGGFQFTDLRPGGYSVGFGDLPPGYTFTSPDQGSNDANDSDADPATGMTGLVTLVPGQNNPTINAGIVPNPTAIALASFTATRDGDQVLVRWETTAELNTWGFQLYRSADDTRVNAVRVTPQLIPGQGRGQGGASYRWTDSDVAAGVTYTYWLVETEIGGATHEYGPATASVAPAGLTYHLFVPMAMR